MPRVPLLVIDDSEQRLAENSLHEHTLTFCEIDRYAGAGIEFKEIFFDSIAEDHAVLGHQ